MVAPALMSSARGDWRTPTDLIEDVRAALGGQIQLDPCASPDPKHWFADTNCCPTAAGSMRIDGFDLQWHRFRTIYFNPPYGRGILRWLDRALAAYRLGAEVVGLLPARTDTQWFTRCWSATRICFLRGRLTFQGAPSVAPFPSAVVYWGDAPRRFELAFRERGHIVTT